MELEFGKRVGNRIEVIRKDAKKFAIYAGYETLPVGSTIGEAEDVYRTLWGRGFEVCKAAGISPTRIRMIVKLLRAEAETSYIDVCDFDSEGQRKIKGWQKRDKPETPPSEAMSIGWRVDLSEEEEARVGDACKEYKQCSAKEEEE